MRTRNLAILFCCQMIAATGSIVMVTLAGIIGARLAGNPSLATLPVSVTVICLAATTVPAVLLMRALGRRTGFALASLSAAGATLFAVWALAAESFAGFVMAAGLFGVNMAFAQQYRYAAAESVGVAYRARAISLVLAGAIGGALVGPELVRLGQFSLGGVQYGGTLLAVAALYLLQAFLFLFLRRLDTEAAAGTARMRRPLGRIASQPLFVVAVLAGTVAYGVMTLIMTGTPISMHINDGYTLEETARVIRNHVLGMYLPSLVSGYLIDRLGTGRLMAVGAAALALACGLALQGQGYLHYNSALILLGIGWNFLYVGGTTMLTLTYSMDERFKAQAVNEFSVFGTAAAASLLAGAVMHIWGWTVLAAAPLPLLLLVFAGLYAVRGDARLRHSPRSRPA